MKMDRFWIEQYVDGELEKKEAKEVEELLARDVEAREYYQFLRRLRQQMKDWSSRWEKSELEVFRQSVAITQKVKLKRRPFWIPLSIAASLIVFLLLGGAFLLSGEKNFSKTGTKLFKKAEVSRTLEGKEEDWLSLLEGEEEVQSFSIPEALDSVLERERELGERKEPLYFDLGQQLEQLLGEKL